MLHTAMSDIEVNTISPRTSRLPASGKVTYEFTEDPDLIRQYIELRRMLYVTDPKFRGFRTFSHLKAEEKEYFTAYVQVARAGQQVIGGACLTIVPERGDLLLPLEKNIMPSDGFTDFRLKRQFPQMDLENCCYAELNRMAVHPDYRQGECLKEMSRRIFDFCRKQGVEYLFVLSDLVRGRAYKKLIKNAFDIDGTVFRDLTLPLKADYENLPMYLMMCPIVRQSKDIIRFVPARQYAAVESIN